MYTVKFEYYICDYNRKMSSKTFGSLTELENWLFDQMQQSYDRMWFPTKEPSRIEVDPGGKNPDIWIYYIESDRGVEFTTGKFTNGQKHWSKDIQKWLTHCNERKKTPSFKFVE